VGVGGFFVFCMFPMSSLRRYQTHVSFYPIIVIQSSTFTYITCRREGDIRKHASTFGSDPCSKNIGDGQSNDSFEEKKTNCPPLTNL